MGAVSRLPRPGSSTRPGAYLARARQKLYAAFCDGAHAFIALSETSVTPAACAEMCAALDALESDRALTGDLIIDMRKRLRERASDAQRRNLRVIRGGKRGA